LRAARAGDDPVAPAVGHRRLAYFLDDLTNGMSRKDVAVAFVASPEFADPTKNPAYACFF